MSNAFAISEDDIMIVLTQEGMNAGVTDENLSEWMDDLDHYTIEAAALHFDDMDEQTNAAHDSIREQLREMGVYDQIKARLSLKAMEQETAQAGPSKPLPRP